VTKNFNAVTVKAIIAVLSILALAGSISACDKTRGAQTPPAGTTPSEPALVPKPVSFFAADGLEVSAALYLEHPTTAPFALLFHMSGSGRGEYRKTVGRLAKLGFNSMAVDQRSGGNETSARALALKLSGTYKDALPDMVAALAFAQKEYAKGKLVLLGSSYSSALALKMAGDDPACCDAVIAFSPSEYFADPGYITRSAKNISVPVFITSGKYEQPDWIRIFEAIPGSMKTSFLPEASGIHGSPALWPETPGSEEYWAAMEEFMRAAKILE